MDYVLECFNAFLQKPLKRYNFGNQVYADETWTGDQSSQNPFLKTEADVQVKFGGFLEQYLYDKGTNLVVHAEMSIYSNPYARADLSIHLVPHGTIWTSKQQILDSLVSVIEIKLATVRQPLYDFETGGVKKDLAMLKGLRSEIKRYLLIADEGNRLKPLQLKDVLEDAKANQVVVLSNNKALMSDIA